jgi:hypothetical protein
LKPPLRKVLADSHVCDVASAALVFFSLDYAFWALSSWPFVQAADFLVTAVAIRGIPSGLCSIINSSTVLATALYLFNSLACLAAAERWRNVLVDTYIGAIALGYLLAGDIVHFVNIFANLRYTSRKLDFPKAIRQPLSDHPSELLTSRCFAQASQIFGSAVGLVSSDALALR